MSIVTCDGGQPHPRQTLVPLPQSFIRTRQVESKDQVRITSPGPQHIKKCDDRIDSPRVRKDVINLNTIEARRVPVLKLFRVSDDRDVIRQCKQSIAIRGADFVAVDKQHATMHTLQRHRRRVKLFLRMLSHDHKLQLISLSCGNDVCERTGAMPSEKRGYMDHTRVLGKAGTIRLVAFGLEFLNGGV